MLRPQWGHSGAWPVWMSRLDGPPESRCLDAGGLRGLSRGGNRSDLVLQNPQLGCKSLMRVPIDDGLAVLRAQIDNEYFECEPFVRLQ